MTKHEQVQYEREPCTRCHGSGNYSYCQSHGTRCFKCGGTGKQLTKRGRAAREYATSRLEVTASEYAEKHQGRVAKFNDGMGRLLGFSGLERRDFSDNPGYALMSKGEVRQFPVGGGQSGPYLIPGSCKVGMVPTEEDIDAIMDYQSSLTKAGKPRKRG